MELSDELKGVPFQYLRYWMGWCPALHECGAQCERRNGHDGSHQAPWLVDTRTLGTVQEAIEWD